LGRARPFCFSLCAPLHSPVLSSRYRDIALKTLRRCSTNHRTPPWNILFFGTDSVSLASLSALYENRGHFWGGRVVSHIEVVCPPAKRGAEPSPIFAFAKQKGITTHQPVSIEEWKVPSLATSGTPFDLGVVVSFGYFIPSHILDALPHGAINMHPSLLPKYRGAAPIYHVLLNGERETGVTVLEIDRFRLDAGNILAQVTYPLDRCAMFNEVTKELAQLGAKLLVSTLGNLQELRRTSLVQPEREAVKAPKIKPSDCWINWRESDPIRVYNKWRALSETRGVYTYYRGMRMKLIRLLPPFLPPDFPQADQAAPDVTPGTLFYDKGQRLLWIKCGNFIGGAGSDTTGNTSHCPVPWIACSHLQLEGKTVVDARSFFNGFLNTAHKRVESGLHALFTSDPPVPTA